VHLRTQASGHAFWWREQTLATGKNGDVLSCRRQRRTK
jgi:hypothetical protein